MGLDGVSLTQQTSQAANLQLETHFQPTRAVDSYCASTLVREGKKPSFFSIERLKEYFWTAWEYAKFPFVKAWEWILWIVRCCPAETTQLEILENILEDPKAAAKEFAENPAEQTGELVFAALMDPSGFKELLDEHPGELGIFMREFKKACKDHEQLFTGKEDGIQGALRSVIDPTHHSGHDLFKALSKIPANLPSLVFGALDRLGKQVLKILGEEDKENDAGPVRALRIVCKGYLPKVVAEAKESPEEFADFFGALYNSELYPVDLFINHAHPGPDGNEAAALGAIFAEEGLVLAQLEEPKKYFGDVYPTKGINMQQAYYQCVLRELTPEVIEEVIKAIGKDHPLAVAILQQAKDGGSDTMKQIAANLPKALEVLQQLVQAYENPPKGKK